MRGLFEEEGVFGVVYVVEFDGAVHIYWKETNVTYISEAYDKFYSQVGYPSPQADLTKGYSRQRFKKWDYKNE